MARPDAVFLDTVVRYSTGGFSEFAGAVTTPE